MPPIKIPAPVPIPGNNAVPIIPPIFPPSVAPPSDTPIVKPAAARPSVTRCTLFSTNSLKLMSPESLDLRSLLMSQAQTTPSITTTRPAPTQFEPATIFSIPSDETDWKILILMPLRTASAIPLATCVAPCAKTLLTNGISFAFSQVTCWLFDPPSLQNVAKCSQLFVMTLYPTSDSLDLARARTSSGGFCFSVSSS